MNNLVNEVLHWLSKFRFDTYRMISFKFSARIDLIKTVHIDTSLNDLDLQGHSCMRIQVCVLIPCKIFSLVLVKMRMQPKAVDLL